VALDGPAPSWPQTLSLQTPEAAARVVDSLHRAGADFIKVYARIPREILLAIAAKADSLGIPFAGHVSTFMNAEEAAAAGQRSLEHTNALDPSSLDVNMMRANITARPPAPLSPTQRAAQIRRLLDTYDSRRLEQAAAVLGRSNTWTTPTLVAMRSLALPNSTLAPDTSTIAAYTPPYIREVWSTRLASVLPAEMFPVMADRLKIWEETIRALHRHGARLLVGSDAWNPNVVPGFGFHEEMELLVAQGITPLEVLRSATLGAAEYLMVQDSLGTISAGKVADLVLLDGDPLVDIRNTRKLHAVVLNGRLLQRADLDTLLRRARAFCASYQRAGAAALECK
jgi:imidazolonepropionase-like amidohydrolase